MGPITTVKGVIHKQRSLDSGTLGCARTCLT